MASTLTFFVSYARADAANAAALGQALKDSGLNVWWDAHIAPGPQWQDVLQQRLSECGVVVVLLGGQGVSGWVRAEVGVALARHFSRAETKPIDIVPVLLADAAVPPFLSLFQFPRLSDPTNPGQLAELACTLAVSLGPGLLRDYRVPPIPPELGRCPFTGLARAASVTRDRATGRRWA